MTGPRPAGRVLYVSYDGLLEPLGASQVLPYVYGLREAGISISVLSFEKREDLVDRGAVEGLARRLRSAGIPWFRRRWHGSPTLPATAWDVRVGWRVVRDWSRELDGPGVVHARGYISGLMAGVARRPGVRVLFDMRGFWVDERIHGGYWTPGGVRARIARWVERRALGAADHLVLLTRRSAERVGDLLPAAAELPVAVIPTCVDMTRFRPAPDPAAARRARGLGSGPILVHTGTLTGWYDGAATMAVARAFVQRTGGRFVVLTRDVDPVRAMVEEAGLDPLIRTVAPSEMPGWLQAADAGLALVRPSPAKDASYPTKVGEYLAAGLAVLATPIGDLPSLADGEVVGLHGEDMTPDQAGAWLAEAVARPDRVRRARERAAARLSLEEGVGRLLDVYRALHVVPEASP